MEQQREGSVKIKDQKKFNPKDAMLVFSMFAIVSGVVLFALIVNDVLTIQQLLSFDEPYAIIMYTVFSVIGLTLFGVLLTLCTPAKHVDDTNQTYQDLSVSTIVGFMLVGALFEELLFKYNVISMKK